jgi:hypothetical protein
MPALNVCIPDRYARTDNALALFIKARNGEVSWRELVGLQQNGGFFSEGGKCNLRPLIH